MTIDERLNVRSALRRTGVYAVSAITTVPARPEPIEIAFVDPNRGHRLEVTMTVEEAASLGDALTKHVEDARRRGQ